MRTKTNPADEISGILNAISPVCLYHVKVKGRFIETTGHHLKRILTDFLLVTRENELNQLLQWIRKSLLIRKVVAMKSGSR